MEKIWISETVNKLEKEVVVAGWVQGRRDHGKIIFIDLRDRSGTLQVVFTPQNETLYKLANTLRPEWVIKITGVIKTRPAGMNNPNIATGNQEIVPSALTVLSKAETPPFQPEGNGYDVNEEIRLRHRYLDLRRERLRKNLILRHEVIRFMRNWLGERGFIEIETPILTKSTPEGARDYVVPSRTAIGKFYALPQSPQQYKQLLMVSGFERYFQIARCFRDEDTRGDRQPEFTQLDIEMSFVEENDILQLIEELYIDTLKTIAPEKTISKIPFPRISYQTAMEKYGTDKPDLRENKNDPNELALAFIVDFPMFEWRKSEKRWDAVHHPFTQPKLKKGGNETANYKEELLDAIQHNPGELLARQYDFVCNGYEIGGGSIRTHDPELLTAIFEAMGHKPEEVKEKFGHLLEAFSYGVPPHGGVAPGIDRFIMILAGEPNIREVIAFPKTGDGRDIMMQAPSEINPNQLKELHLKILDPKHQTPRSKI